MARRSLSRHPNGGLPPQSKRISIRRVAGIESREFGATRRKLGPLLTTAEEGANASLALADFLADLGENPTPLCRREWHHVPVCVEVVPHAVAHAVLLSAMMS